LTNKSNLIGRL